jgi:hypothetical protein
MIGRDPGQALKHFLTPEQFARMDQIMKRELERAKYRDQQFVVAECQSLAQQLSKIAEAFGPERTLSELPKNKIL